MEKSKKKEEKVKVISVLPYFFIGVFILLLLAGVDYICPEYLREDDEKNNLSNDLMLARSLIKFGRGASILLVIVLPALMNIATYIICGFWMSILFQIVLYYTIINKVY